jgi:hypothetical protein
MLVLPTPLAEALSRFDGRRPTDQACAEIASEAGIMLDRATVRQLVDFGVLLAMPAVNEAHHAL